MLHGSHTLTEVLLYLNISDFLWFKVWFSSILTFFLAREREAMKDERTHYGTMDYHIYLVKHCTIVIDRRDVTITL